MLTAREYMTIARDEGISMPDSSCKSGATRPTGRDGVYMRWAVRAPRHTITVLLSNITKAQAGPFRLVMDVSDARSPISGIR